MEQGVRSLIAAVVGASVGTGLALITTFSATPTEVPSQAVSARLPVVVTASPPPSCTTRGTRAVRVYSEMLANYRNDLRPSDTAYVVTATQHQTRDGQMRIDGQMPADVASCISGGLAGFPHVVLVSSASDPRIPNTTGQGSAVVRDGFVVTFGSLPAGSGTTEVSISTGGGFGFRGGQYCIKATPGSPLRVTQCGEQWIS